MKKLLSDDNGFFVGMTYLDWKKMTRDTLNVKILKREFILLEMVFRMIKINLFKNMMTIRKTWRQVCTKKVSLINRNG